MKDHKQTLMRYISMMPDDIKNIIKEYLRVPTIIFITKDNYIFHHKYLKPYIIKNRFEAYIRNVIKQDHEFVFNQLIHENIEKWILLKNYIHKNIIYKNYVYFLIFFCIDCDSIRCYNTINVFLKQKQMCQNRHKKNILKCIK
jgi:hypothetical protein